MGMLVAACVVFKLLIRIINWNVGMGGEDHHILYSSQVVLVPVSYSVPLNIYL